MCEHSCPVDLYCQAALCSHQPLQRCCWRDAFTRWVYRSIPAALQDRGASPRSAVASLALQPHF